MVSPLVCQFQRPSASQPEIQDKASGLVPSGLLVECAQVDTMALVVPTAVNPPARADEAKMNSGGDPDTATRHGFLHPATGRSHSVCPCQRFVNASIESLACFRGCQNCRRPRSG